MPTPRKRLVSRPAVGSSRSRRRTWQFARWTRIRDLRGQHFAQVVHSLTSGAVVLVGGYQYRLV